MIAQSPPLPAPLVAALAANAAVVTPNERLARFLRRAAENRHVAGGDPVWPTVRVASWSGWLRELWEDAVVGGAAGPPPVRLSALQALQVWCDVVAGSREVPALVHPRQAAALAQQAWTLFHDWRPDAADLPWQLPTPLLGDDAVAFATWSRRYAARCRDESWIDEARLADELAGMVARGALPAPRVLVLAGFVELAPAQRRLADALRAAGGELLAVDLVAPGDPLRVAVEPARDPIEEIFAAAQWARACVLREPAARIAVVVPSLAATRVEVTRAFEQVLSPSRALAGASAADRAFNVSLGAPIAAVPLASSALCLLALAAGPIPAADAGLLLGSRHLAGADAEAGSRGEVERRLADEGRTEVDLRALVAMLAAAGSGLAPRWARWRRELDHAPRRVAPGEWRALLPRWLETAGWLGRDSGDAPLASDDFQARAALDDLLDRWASLGVVRGRLDLREAVSGIRALAAEQPFQPESPDLPVQVLGELEAAGMPFDALRVCGLTADAWPRPPQPNPLLPLPWQRRHDVPRSSAKREQAYAARLLALFAGAAAQVRFTWPTRRGDEILEASPLIAPAHGSSAAAPACPAIDTAPLARALRASPAVESWIDAGAPALAQGSSVRGGAGLLEKQADCPFKAAASHRLAAEPWPEGAGAHGAAERGIAVHAALRAFFEGVRSQEALAELADDELDRRLDAAAQAGVEALPDGLWAELPPLVAAVERARLQRLVRAWLEIERARPPFAIVALEQTQPVSIGGLCLTVRLDRVDRVADGRLVVIDYKTGKAPSAARLAARVPDGRLEAAQLPVYLRAVEQGPLAAPVAAIVYGSVRVDGVKPGGVASDPAVWPGVAAVGELKDSSFADWETLVRYWDDAAEALAEAVRRGRAEVSPRRFPQTCGTCGHQPLCRIGELRARTGRATMTDVDGEDAHAEP